MRYLNLFEEAKPAYAKVAEQIYLFLRFCVQSQFSISIIVHPIMPAM